MFSRAFLGAFLCALAMPSSADAAPKKQILVMRVEGEGIDNDLLNKMNSAVRKQTAESTKPSKILPAPALDFESMRVTAGCSDDNAKCLAAIGDTLGATHVVRVRVAKLETGARFLIQTARVKDRKGASVSADVLSLDGTAIDELRHHLAVALGDKKPPKKPEGPGSIVLVAADGDSLEEIEIFLDDRKVPVHALKVVSAGPHDLEVHKPGFEVFTWSGRVNAGQVTRLVVEHKPKVDPDAVVAAKVDPETPRIDEKPAVREEPREVPSVRPDPKTSDPAIVAQVEEPREEPRLFYTWMFAGGAAVLTTVGIASYLYMGGIEDRLIESCGGADKVMVVNGKQQCVGGDPAFAGCPDGGDSLRCNNGELASTMTYVGFIGAGLLGAATIASFVLEDGPLYFSSDEPEYGAFIGPIEGGAAASVTIRY